MRFLILFLTTIVSSLLQAQEYGHAETITFYAQDSVLVTADTYFIKDVAPTVLLCHQAGYSRGEYLETAKKLNALGYSCMAIDQRSGMNSKTIKKITPLS